MTNGSCVHFMHAGTDVVLGVADDAQPVLIEPCKEALSGSDVLTPPPQGASDASLQLPSRLVRS